MRRIIVGAVIALAMVGCSSHTMPTGREGDVAFAQAMIPHHEQALEMAEIALTKDTSKPLADLAREIRRQQDPEIVLMRAWLDEWGAEELSHGAGPGSESEGADHEHDMAGMDGMATGDQMRELADATGSDFEARWLALMIAHHEGAITMAEQVRDGTEDPDVRALAEEIITAQRDEIDRMATLQDR